MNALPEHRRALFGRTFSRPWAPGEFDPIAHYRRPSPAERVAGVLLATVIGILGAAALVNWWSA